MATNVEDLMKQASELSNQIVVASRECDPRRQADLRLQRAWIEWQLREAWTPGTPRGRQQNDWLWEDITQAVKLLTELGRRVGDQQLVNRVLRTCPPRLRAAIERPPADRPLVRA